MDGDNRMDSLLRKKRSTPRTSWGMVVVYCLLILTSFAYCCRVELFG